jgi:hypothetical protein
MISTTDRFNGSENDAARRELQQQQQRRGNKTTNQQYKCCSTRDVVDEDETNRDMLSPLRALVAQAAAQASISRDYHHHHPRAMAPAATSNNKEASPIVNAAAHEVTSLDGLLSSLPKARSPDAPAVTAQCTHLLSPSVILTKPSQSAQPQRLYGRAIQHQMQSLEQHQMLFLQQEQQLEEEEKACGISPWLPKSSSSLSKEAVPIGVMTAAAASRRCATANNWSRARDNMSCYNQQQPSADPSVRIRYFGHQRVVTKQPLHQQQLSCAGTTADVNNGDR